MSSEILCACCHHKIDFNSFPVCDRCGYLNMAIVGDSNVSDEAALSYRRNLLSKLTDISVVGYQYGWKENTQKYELLSTKSRKIADGIECEGRIMWSDLDYGQWYDEKKKEVDVEISFSVEGKAHTVKHTFKPVKSTSFWHVGAMVTEDMNLVIYFGSKEDAVPSDGMDFIALLSK